ncbi:AP2/ERF family transcription factor [Diaphorobacter caeni]|uniref:AP2/ERF family transcription factor n=1 Tax=Diaphorobacter caeni TaxID=2784387 RepID=UPI00189015A5|nr:AP2/ERF family transcription factor [Diaphorobacter caeni]MBF5005291.1 AP2 domain-containing protein [Diaphorobacter caeni]
MTSRKPAATANPEPRVKKARAKRELSSYSIVRVDTINARGIPVHLWTTSIKRQGVDIVRHFYDGVYGDKASALLMAEAYRDAAMRLFPPRTQREQSMKLRSSNTSGTSGVQAIHKKGKLVAWLATLSIGREKPRRRYFSVKDHGEERAQQLAIAAREELLREYPDSFATVHPDATASANAHFAHLVDAQRIARDEVAPAPDADELKQRLEWLNAWFDALKPRHVHVRISTYTQQQRGHDAILAIINNGGPPSQLKRKTWSLLHASWEGRQAEVWSFIQSSLRELMGTAYALEFQRLFERDFLASTAQTGFFVRHRLDDPASDYLRNSPPAELRPLLQGFCVPRLPQLQTVSSAG